MRVDLLPRAHEIISWFDDGTTRLIMKEIRERRESAYKKLRSGDSVPELHRAQGIMELADFLLELQDDMRQVLRDRKEKEAKAANKGV